MNTKVFSSETANGVCDKTTAESTLLSRKVPWQIELVELCLGLGLDESLGILSGLVKSAGHNPLH